MTRMFEFPAPDSGDEPVRDERLGALLRETVGEPPIGDVDWSALANRVGSAVRSHHGAPWWIHVERWRRGAVPLAFAAGLVGALALWNAALGASSESVAYGAGEAVSAVVAGASSDEVARSYAGFVTGSSELGSTEVPE